MTTFVFPRKNLMVYSMILGSLLFISTRNTILLCASFLYLSYLPSWKVEFGVLFCVDYIQTLFDGLTRGVSNLCETKFLIN